MEFHHNTTFNSLSKLNFSKKIAQKIKIRFELKIAQKSDSVKEDD